MMHTPQEGQVFPLASADTEEGGVPCYWVDISMHVPHSFSTDIKLDAYGNDVCLLLLSHGGETPDTLFGLLWCHLGRKGKGASLLSGREGVQVPQVVFPDMRRGVND